MARIFEPSPGQLARWAQWLAAKPPAIQALGEHFEPWSLYRHKITNQLVTIAAFFEDGTVSIDVLPQFNPLWIFGFQVFGVDPDNLEPANIPGWADLSEFVQQ